MPVKSGFYPIHVRESRYQGTYCGARWVLIAGILNIEDNTDAFASDSECMAFWHRVEQEGPILEVPDPFREGELQEIYVTTGSDPNRLIQELVHYEEE